MGLIEQIQAEPFAGAFRWLRAIDPLYQAETGDLREWEVRGGGDECPCCGSVSSEPVYFTVLAFTAIEALREAENHPKAHGAWIDEVRLAGSGARFIHMDEVAP
jgi:hypothetical protein